MSPISFDFNLTPKEAIDYLKSKGRDISFNYEEMMHDAHHRSFTVAKVTRMDLLSDIHKSLVQAMDRGELFDTWRKNIEPELKKYGWWGEQMLVDPKTGETKTIHVNARRLRTIYDTNMRVAYAAGAYKQAMELPDAVYWRYDAILDGRTRPTHMAKNGIILHRDDPWWRINKPPNAWNCRCMISVHTKAYLDAKGLKVSPSPSEDIASPDWAYDIAAGNRVGKLTKIDLDESLSMLPTITPNKAYADLAPDELKQKFYDDLGMTAGTVYIDKVGDPTWIDDELFHGFGGYFKPNDGRKISRILYLDEFAKTIVDPDEIWVGWEKMNNPNEKYPNPKERFVKKFLRYFVDEKGNKKGLIALFEYLKDKTQGVSLYVIDSSGTLERKRGQKLIWQKESWQD